MDSGYTRYFSMPVFCPKGSVIEWDSSADVVPAWCAISYTSPQLMQSVITEQKLISGYVTEINWTHSHKEIVSHQDGFLFFYVRSVGDNSILDPTTIPSFYVKRPFWNQDLNNTYYIPNGIHRYETYNNVLYIERPIGWLRGAQSGGLSFQNIANFNAAVPEGMSWDITSPNEFFPNCLMLSGNCGLFFDLRNKKFIILNVNDDDNYGIWWSGSSAAWQTTVYDFLIPLVICSTSGALVGGLCKESYESFTKDYYLNKELLSNSYCKLSISEFAHDSREQYSVDDGYSRYLMKPVIAPKGSIIICEDQSFEWYPTMVDTSSNVRGLFSQGYISSGYHNETGYDIQWRKRSFYVVPFYTIMYIAVRISSSYTQKIDEEDLAKSFYILRPCDTVAKRYSNGYFVPGPGSRKNFYAEEEGTSTYNVYITRPYGFLRGDFPSYAFNTSALFTGDVDWSVTSPKGKSNCCVLNRNAALIYNVINGNMEIIDTDNQDYSYWWTGRYSTQQRIYPQSDWMIPLIIVSEGEITGGIASKWYEINTSSTEMQESIQEIPLYWKNSIDNRINTYMNNLCEKSIHTDSFIFITDVHWNGNAKNSPALIKYIEDRTPIKKVFFGGDIGQQFSSIDQAINVNYSFMNSMVGLNMYPTLGNHDYNTNSSSSDYPLSLSQVYNSTYKEVENYTDTNRKTYYYIDNITQKIRYFLLCTEETKKSEVSDTQLDWFKNKAMELSDEWTIVVFFHRYWYGDYATGKTDEEIIAENIDNMGARIKTAVDYVVANSNVTIAGLITGHVHRDLSTMSAQGYPIITTSCDTHAGSAAWDPDMPNRSVGNTSEQLFDIFTIDCENKTIESLRIGPGIDRNWTYS